LQFWKSKNHEIYAVAYSLNAQFTVKISCPEAVCMFANMFCLDCLVKAKLNILGCQYLLVNFCGMLDQYFNLLVKFCYQAMAASYVFFFV